MDTLADELLLEIFLFLNVKSALKKKLVCKNWKDIMSTKYYWKKRYEHLHGNIFDINIENKRDLTVKELVIDESEKIFFRDCREKYLQQLSLPFKSSLYLNLIAKNEYEKLFHLDKQLNEVILVQIDDNTALYRHKIHDFKQKRSTNSRCSSKEFYLSFFEDKIPHKFALEVYTNGQTNKNPRTTDLSIFLGIKTFDEKYIPKNFRIKFEFTLFIINRKNPNLTIFLTLSKEITMSEMSKSFRNGQIGWGVREFISVGFLDRFEGYIVDDSLEIQLLLRILDDKYEQC